MAQTVKIKSNTTNASAIPASLQAKEIASNILDRSLFIGDGSSVIRLYTGTTKYFDADGFANNALKLGGVAASDYATQTWVTNKGYLSTTDASKTYQTKLSLTNKLNASYISGLATVATSGKYSDLTGVPTSLPASDVYSWAKAATKPSYAFSEITSKPTTLAGYGITDFVRSNVADSINNYTTQAGIYRLSSYANSTTPDNAGYGTALTLYAGADTWSQIYASYGLSQNDAGLYWRGATTSNNDVAWRRVLDSANYSSYTYPKADIDTKLESKLNTSGGAIKGLLNIYRNNAGIRFFSTDGTTALGWFGFSGEKTPVIWDSLGLESFRLYHTGNFNPANYLPLSGGTISGGSVKINYSEWTEFGITRGDLGSSSIGGIDGAGVYFAHTLNNVTTYMYLKAGVGLTIYSNLVATGTIAMGTLSSSSDARLKDNIELLTDDESLAVLRQLRPSKWNWKSNGALSYGFIAQEVESVASCMVDRMNDEELGQKLYLQYNQLHAFEVGAIQHIDSEVEQLKKDLKSANTKIEKLENELKQYRRTAICQ